MAGSALAQALSQGVSAWNLAHPAQQIDPQAALAVSSQEGLGGGIGDNGTSFGPFQLHYGGAYPSSAPQGASASQQWAWSPQGIQYALGQIAGVAGGLRGAPAVTNIVDRFERPANPTAEVAGALHAYGFPGPSGAQMPMPTLGSLTQPQITGPLTEKVQQRVAPVARGILAARQLIGSL